MIGERADEEATICNLYSHTKGQQAILAFTRAMVDRTGNLPPQPGDASA